IHERKGITVISTIRRLFVVFVILALLLPQAALAREGVIVTTEMPEGHVPLVDPRFEQSMALLSVPDDTWVGFEGYYDRPDYGSVYGAQFGLTTDVLPSSIPAGTYTF